jgi:hypothetical protein
MPVAARVLVALLGLGLGLGLTGCGSSPAGAHDAAPPDDAAPRDDAASQDDATPQDDAAPSAICDLLGLPVAAFAPGGTGTHRGEVAGDFTLPLVGGGAFTLSERWSGCETYVFVPDTYRISDLDATSLWTDDVALLVATSPRNAHYLFVSRQATDAEADAATAAMARHIVDQLATLEPADAAHWRERLHVVAGRAATLGGWLQPLLTTGLGRIGLVIDRGQRLRGVGMLADVTQYDQALADAGKWPWRNSLSYAAYEAQWSDARAARDARLAADGATVVPVWEGETIGEYAETDVTLPSAAELEAFDTLEIEVRMECPDAEALELGNCGAWDYIAALTVTTGAGNQELARFITSYHRETHWVVDATPLIPLLAAGGSQHFRWDASPSWNPQPAVTTIRLRFSNRAVGVRPTAATFLWAGGAFDASYDAARTPIDVAIPASAARVELVAVITGHGSEANQCAEFCNHQHEFKLGGGTYLAQFPVAGRTQGCMARIADGMTPNQGGTWWYGRGGWCPGLEVDPWIVDVTADVTPGATATVQYRGLYGGAPPTTGRGTIDLASWLVVYE